MPAKPTAESGLTLTASDPARWLATGVSVVWGLVVGRVWWAQSIHPLTAQMRGDQIFALGAIASVALLLLTPGIGSLPRRTTWLPHWTSGVFAASACILWQGGEARFLLTSVGGTSMALVMSVPIVVYASTRTPLCASEKASAAATACSVRLDRSAASRSALIASSLGALLLQYAGRPVGNSAALAITSTLAVAWLACIAGPLASYGAVAATYAVAIMGSIESGTQVVVRLDQAGALSRADSVRLGFEAVASGMANSLPTIAIVQGLAILLMLLERGRLVSILQDLAPQGLLLVGLFAFFARL